MFLYDFEKEIITGENETLWVFLLPVVTCTTRYHILSEIFVDFVVLAGVTMDGMQSLNCTDAFGFLVNFG